MKKKKRKTQPWWSNVRFWRRAGITAAVILLVGVGGWYLVKSGESNEPAVYLTEPAADFSLPTIDGGELTLADHRGEHNMLLYFSEGIGCGACWDQIVDLEEVWDKFEPLNVQLVNIMVDPPGQLEAEAQRRGITTTLAYDQDKSVSLAYNALEASMHPGQKPGHSFYLVNKSGVIIWRWEWTGHGKPMYVETSEIYDEVSKWLERAG